MIGRIIYAIRVGNQCVEQCTDFEQLMPVPTRTRQTRHLNAKHQTDVAKTNFRDQALEAKPALDRRARSPKIVVNDDDGLACPAKLVCSLD